MHGVALAWRLVIDWPHVPVTLISGGAAPSVAMLPPGVTFLAKPLRMCALVEQARCMIQKGRGRHVP
jgi:hypothetical protein